MAVDKKDLDLGKGAPQEFYLEVNEAVPSTGSLRIPVSMSDANSTASIDTSGSIMWDDNSIYVNTSAGWKSASLA